MVSEPTYYRDHPVRPQAGHEAFHTCTPQEGEASLRTRLAQCDEGDARDEVRRRPVPTGRHGRFESGAAAFSETDSRLCITCELLRLVWVAIARSTRVGTRRLFLRAHRIDGQYEVSLKSHGRLGEGRA